MHCTKELGSFKCSSLEKVPFNFEAGKTYRIGIYFTAYEAPRTFDWGGDNYYRAIYVQSTPKTYDFQKTVMSQAGGLARPGQWMANQSLSVTGLPTKITNFNLTLQTGGAIMSSDYQGWKINNGGDNIWLTSPAHNPGMPSVRPNFARNGTWLISLNYAGTTIKYGVNLGVIITATYEIGVP